MTKKCECPVRGFCTRHQMAKNARQYELCQMDNEMGEEYRKLWDRQTERKKEPSLLSKAVNLAGAVVRHVAGGLRATPDDSKRVRLEICNQCPSLRDGKCVECGCSVEKKVGWASEGCPLKKWLPIGSKDGCGCGGQ